MMMTTRISSIHHVCCIVVFSHAGRSGCCFDCLAAAAAAAACSIRGQAHNHQWPCTGANLLSLGCFQGSATKQVHVSAPRNSYSIYLGIDLGL
eukprot:1161201-Pelagomonas_calceolata.AAC.22